MAMPPAAGSCTSTRVRAQVLEPLAQWSDQTEQEIAELEALRQNKADASKDS